MNTMKNDFDFDEFANAATDEEMKSEALDRIDFWIKSFGLNPNIYGYFKEGRLYYSYLTAGGFIGSIDTISYDKKYEKLVKEFEDDYDTVVYHCIESKTVFGNSLIMLYIGRDKDEWSAERPFSDGFVMANVYNLDEDDNEIGLVKFEAYQGALVRVM